MYEMKILAPAEAVPLLLDRKRSPIVALDTEFDASMGSTRRASLNGLSLAGGTPETGFFGAFWPFGNAAHEVVPWGWLRERVLVPLFSDAERTIAMHPPKVDMQILRARDVAVEDVRARIACTMSMAHVFDENLPKSLKDLAQTLLGVTEVSSYAETQREIRSLYKEGEKLSRSIVKACWETYRDERKKAVSPATFDPAWPSWKRLVMSLPVGLTKAKVEEAVAERITKVVMGDYGEQARVRFAKYGAEDALFTLGICYWLSRELPQERAVVEAGGKRYAEHLDRETRVCHPLVTELEENGLKIDIPLLRAMHGLMTSYIDAVRNDVVARWGIAPTVEAAAEDEEDDAEFNPGSSDQVADIVWNKWKLRAPPWTQSGGGELKPKWVRAKDGLCKVDKDVLAWLGDHAPEPYKTHIAKLLELRRFGTLMSNFVSPLLALASVDPEGRVHPSFWPVGARTGRFSCGDPNVENIPRPYTMPKIPIPPGCDPAMPPPGLIVEKDKDGKVVAWRIASLRKVFIARPGYVLVSIDLSQIENRLMAHETGDLRLRWIYRRWDCADCRASGETVEPLHKCPNCGAKDGKRDKTHPDQPAIKGFCLGFDIHAATSVAIGFDKKYGAAEGRQRGKPVNHAASYGMGAPTLARREGMTVREAEEALEAWHRRYPLVREMHAQVWREIQEHGYVTMFDGTIRRFYAAQMLLHSNNFAPWEREGIVREGVNCKAQGGTGIIMKRGMLSSRERFNEIAKKREEFRHVYLVNQVHDEALYECPESIAKEVLGIGCWELEHAATLAVPVIAEGGIGKTWGDAH